MNANTDVTLKRIDDISARVHVGVTRSADDTLDLRYGWWSGGARADAAKPKRFVVFLNGRTEWLEKYSYLAEDLALPPDTGFLSWDHRGQGASGGARSFVDDFESYARDAQHIVEEVVGDRPYVVLSHSMGGLIALYATLKGYLSPQAMVLSSPLLGLPNVPVPRALARPVATALTACRLGTLSSGAGSFTNIPFEANWLTHDVDLYRRMQNSPYKIPGATFGWVAATFRAIDACFAPEALAGLTTPTLLIGGSKEQVVDGTAFHAWVQAASRSAPGSVQLRLIPGARHELLSEIPAYYAPTLAEIRGWFAPHWRAT